MAKYTMKQHEEYLNEIGIQDPDEFIIGGKMRWFYYYKNQYGTATRKFNPLGFRLSMNKCQKDIISKNKVS